MYRRKDAVYVRAKATGYRSRAAFKLRQLAARWPLFHRGDCVVDLGAWPGGWLQVAAEQVGPTGTVIGIDLRPIAPIPRTPVVTIVGNIRDPDARHRVAAACGAGADVVLSDAAPQLTGVRAHDTVQMELLLDCALCWAEGLLKPGGRLVVKGFMTGALRHYVARVRERFREVHLTRPPATRKGSAEAYIVALGFHGRQIAT